MTPMTKVRSAAACAPRRGRPKNTIQTMSVNVRVTERVYDAYYRAAKRSGQSIHAVLRHILSLHAPSEDS